MDSLILAGVCLTAAAVVGMIIYIKSLKTRFSALFSYFTQKAENEPSEFALDVNTLLDGAVVKFKDSLTGRAAGAVAAVKRQENAILEDVIGDMAGQQNPLLGMAWNYVQENFPSVAKRITDNPSAAVGLFNLVKEGKIPIGGAIPAAGNGHSNYAERLAKYG